MENSIVAAIDMLQPFKLIVIQNETIEMYV